MNIKPNHETWWPSPAKINLFLHINGRYDNGYHRLQTLFQLLDSGDKLAFAVRRDGKLTLSPSIKGVPDEENLIVRAARLLQSVSQTSLGADIKLHKVLPMGGGIGGGSSNAATVLVALNHLWKTGLSSEHLSELGLHLGADVPVFVRGVSGFATGVGEEITAATLPSHYFLIVTPDVHVSTAEIFNLPELPRNTPLLAWEDYRFETTHNDCEEIVTNRYPEVANLLQWLLNYAPSRMTGTGASVFAVFESKDLAVSVQNKLPKQWQSFVAKGVNRSPLIKTLNSVND